LIGLQNHVGEGNRFQSIRESRSHTLSFFGNH
jgi:hypothetical protein